MTRRPEVCRIRSTRVNSGRS